MAVSPSLDTGIVGTMDDVAEPLALLADLGADFAATNDIGHTVDLALERITEYLKAEGGALFTLNDARTTLTCEASYGATAITGITLKSDHGIVGRSVTNNRGEIIEDVGKDPDFFGGVDEKTGYVTRSILCAPMAARGRAIGAIELINKRGGDHLFTPRDLQILQAMSAAAALAILNARMAAALVEQERVKRELELAAEIQRSLLPQEPDPSFPLHGINLPARTVSGDFYDFFRLGDGRVCFSLGDVSGKGMNAALLMAKTASLFRCLGKSIEHPGHLLTRINSEIVETATRGMFVTMVAGIFDPATGHIEIANAGHEPPLVHGRDGTFSAIEAGAPPLGIVPDLDAAGPIAVTELDLDGGALYIFTDGVTESESEDGIDSDVEALMAVISGAASLPLAQRPAAIVAGIGGGSGTLRDDMTVLVIQAGEGASGKGART
jgi:sigma-B regulation protein RsbU (phosphoserine phosphatase)